MSRFTSAMCSVVFAFVVQTTHAAKPHSDGTVASPARTSPNVVLMMSDDQGWGETGYNGHPHLKTPTLDAMAAAGLRLDRFYAASPVCTRHGLTMA